MKPIPLEPLAPAEAAALDARLRELRAGLGGLPTPESIEAALVAGFRRHHARPRLWWMPPLALAATVATVSWLVRAPLPPDPALEAPSPPSADAGPFLALRPLERIALEPGTSVVATEFPRAMLADWGLPVAPERAAEPVRAEVLVSAQGEALALRVLE